MKSSKVRVNTKSITYFSVCLGVVMCFLAAIWSPEEWVKWTLSAIYLVVVAKWFGVTFRTEEIKGLEIYVTDGKELRNFYNMKRAKK